MSWSSCSLPSLPSLPSIMSASVQACAMLLKTSYGYSGSWTSSEQGSFALADSAVTDLKIRTGLADQLS